MARVGIIGGSGLYQIDGIENLDTVQVDTPFGQPSDQFITGTLEGRDVVFLARHGKGHTLSPTELNSRANIWALKKLGAESILAISAVGSLREDYEPTDMVIIDNFVDRTNQARSNTFFGNGIVAHIQFSHPLCETIREALIAAGKKVMQHKLKDGGTYLNMEGPQFSTLAESQLYRKWGMDVIGMTLMNEARLAREAEMCYAALCMVTDFDCWHAEQTGETVSVELVLHYLQQNSKNAKEIIRQTLPLLTAHNDCSCKNALQNSFLTQQELWPKKTIKSLGPIIEKYTSLNRE